MAYENFQTCLTEVLRHEGGYADNPADPGGATNMGITRKTLARWRKISPWQNLPTTAVQRLSRKEATAIYAKFYWTPIGGNALPSGLDLALFDFAVNSGPSRAIRTLQELLDVPRDGRLGPVTLGATRVWVRDAGPGPLIQSLCAARMRFLRKLSTFPVFGRGRTRRVVEIETKALAIAATGENSPKPSRRSPMDILAGYRTYIMAALMLAAGIAQLAGLDVPGFDGQSAGQLIVEGLAIIFLRKGVKSDLANA